MLEELVDRRGRIHRGNRTLIALRLILATLSLLILLLQESALDTAASGAGRGSAFFTPGQITALTFSKDGTRLFSGGSDATIRIWDVATGSEVVPTIEGHGDLIHRIEISPSGEFLASGSADGTVRIFNVPKENEVAELVKTLDIKSPVTCLSWSPDGNRLLTAGMDQELQIWDFETGKPVFTGDRETKDLVFAAFLDQAQQLVLVTVSGTVLVWDFPSSSYVMAEKGHLFPVQAAALSNDGQYLATGGGLLRVWDLKAHKSIHVSEGHKATISALRFGADNFLLSGSRAGHLKAWDLDNKIPVRKFGKHRDWVLSLAGSGDGSLIATGTGDQVIRLWDPKTGVQIRELAGHRTSLRSVISRREQTSEIKAIEVPLYWRPEGLVVIIVLLLTILYTWALRRKELAPKLAYLQAVVDAGLISALVYQTGGAQSPFVTLYLISVASVAFVLSKKGALSIAALSSTLFSLLVLAYGIGQIPEAYLSRISDFQLRRIQYVHWLDYIRMLLLPVFGFFLVAVLAGNLSERLTVTHLLHHEILEGIGEGVLVLDLDQNVLYHNQEVLGLLGRSGNLKGMPLKELLGEQAHQNAGQALFDGTLRKLEISYKQGSGKVLPFEIRTIPVVDEGQPPKGLIVVIDDVTAEKKMEELFKHKERIDAMGQISASIAHEIRNPLASIRGAVQEIARAVEMSEDKKILIEIVLSESDRLDQIISDFLKYARMRPPKHERVEMGSLLSDLKTMLVSRPEAREVEIQLEVQGGNQTIMADPEQLRQVFINLGINALQALNETEKKKLEIRMQAQHLYDMPGVGEKALVNRVNRPGVTIEVLDTGSGIAPDVRKQLFEPFFTTKTGGTGLGLAIVGRIIQGHEGLITVLNVEGGGTRFVVWLPLEFQ